MFSSYVTNVINITVYPEKLLNHTGNSYITRRKSFFTRRKQLCHTGYIYINLTCICSAYYQIGFGIQRIIKVNRGAVVFKKLSTIKPFKIENFCWKVLLIFFYLLKIFWKYSIYDIIFMWQFFIYHPTNYEMTNSIFGTLTFNFMNEQMHISGFHFN